MEFLVKDKSFVTTRDYYFIVDGKLNAYAPPYETIPEFLENGWKIISEEEFNKAEREYELSLCNDWTEITESQYEYALEVLPPLKWHNGGFFISEPMCGMVYGFYQEWHGKYYTSLQIITTPRQKIVDNLMEYISKEGAA